MEEEWFIRSEEKVNRGKLRKAFCNELKSLQARQRQPEGNFRTEMTIIKSKNAFLQTENLLDLRISSFRFPKVLWGVLLFMEGFSNWDLDLKSYLLITGRLLLSCPSPSVRKSPKESSQSSILSLRILTSHIREQANNIKQKKKSQALGEYFRGLLWFAQCRYLLGVSPRHFLMGRDALRQGGAFKQEVAWTNSVTRSGVVVTCYQLWDRSILNAWVRILLLNWDLHQILFQYSGYSKDDWDSIRTKARNNTQRKTPNVWMGRRHDWEDH